jgi:hypothetical protein
MVRQRRLPCAVRADCAVGHGVARSQPSVRGQRAGRSMVGQTSHGTPFNCDLDRGPWHAWQRRAGARLVSARMLQRPGLRSGRDGRAASGRQLFCHLARLVRGDPVRLCAVEKVARRTHPRLHPSAAIGRRISGLRIQGARRLRFASGARRNKGGGDQLSLARLLGGPRDDGVKAGRAMAAGITTTWPEALANNRGKQWRIR